MVEKNRLGTEQEVWTSDSNSATNEFFFASEGTLVKDGNGNQGYIRTLFIHCSNLSGFSPIDFSA